MTKDGYMNSRLDKNRCNYNCCYSRYNCYCSRSCHWHNLLKEML